MTKMVKVLDFPNDVSLFQCQTCKRIEMCENGSPECTCEDDLYEEFFSTRGKSLLCGDTKE